MSSYNRIISYFLGSLRIKVCIDRLFPEIIINSLTLATWTAVSHNIMSWVIGAQGDLEC